MLNSIINEIPYARDSTAGYILGISFALIFYIIVPLENVRELIPVSILLFVINTGYAFLGIAKYLNKSNKPRHVILDAVLNYTYLWRRSR
jgi:hypothetical protein